MVLYVDDMLVTCKNKVEIDQLKSELTKVLHRFDMDSKTKPVNTHFPSHFMLSALLTLHTDEESECVVHV